MIRLAISNPIKDCVFCGNGLETGADLCSSCQYSYLGEADYRTDYANQTVGWFETEEQAKAAQAALVES